MRRLQSVLARFQKTKKPPQKLLMHLVELLLMFPGRATFRHLSRYSPYQEKTCTRWYAKGFDVVSLNKAAIAAVIPPAHEQGLVMDASCVAKRGTHTYGLDRFWNGSHRRMEKGLEISALAWLDITRNCADGLSIEQTPSTVKATDRDDTRMDVNLDQLISVVSEQELGSLRSVVTTGYDSNQKFLGGVWA